MTKSLSQADIKELRYQCRMGYLLPVFLCALLSYVIVGFHQYNSDFEEIVFTSIDGLIILACVIFSIWVSYQMNGKYYQDIRNNIKVAERKVIQKKQAKRDFEAGSGNMTTLPHNNPMNEFTRFDFIMDNTLYRVDKDLFESCSDGDKVSFYYAPKSKYLLSIEKD
ncbi:hypothetical protein [Carboxylicivirga marina]|uniref:DUF3592 domain-containing protein n=1 Tax=Carboxylicivirga marina TaxID=2800988 RepID=A0ABS1HQ41_9BACT|nr:hypothetical protein [Carboxylicivirga marina]MBK3519766.1 hypothetical protein [Carboxylicivirga marina]